MLHKSKLMLPILAVIVGVAASAFTTTRTHKVQNSEELYWFQTDPQTTMPEHKAIEDAPYGCQNLTLDFCAAGWTDYTTNSSGQYIPAGTHVKDVNKTN